MKDWTGVGRRSIYAPLGASGHSMHERQVHDYYATSPVAVDYLFHVIGNDLSGSVWECACGAGHLSKRMHELRPDLIIKNSDIHDRGFPCEIIDFLKYHNPNSFDGDIITNPPYRYAQQFVQKALQTVCSGRLVCMFLKLTFLEGKSRRRLFAAYPPKTVYVFSHCIKCAINGNFNAIQSSAVAYAWFVWQKGFCGETVLKWL